MKTKTTHTQGPWHHGEPFTLKPDHRRENQWTAIGFGNGAAHIGYVSVTACVSSEEAQANVRLITAAPDLLAQLQRLVGIICSLEGFEERDVTIEDCDEAKSLIIKVTGSLKSATINQSK